MNMPAALFSTCLGQYTPRSLEHLLPPVIVRSYPEADKYALIDVLRAKWPVVCEAIEPTFRICDYFDEVDAHVQGHFFLCDVLTTLAGENEMRVHGIDSYAELWRKANQDRFMAIGQETEFWGFFTPEESGNLGVNWLLDVFNRLKELRQQASIANISGKHLRNPDNGKANTARNPHPNPASSSYAPLIQAQRNPSMPLQTQSSNGIPTAVNCGQGPANTKEYAQVSQFRQQHDNLQLESTSNLRGFQPPTYEPDGYGRERIFSAPPHHNRSNGPANMNGVPTNIRGRHPRSRPVQDHLDTDNKPFKLQQTSAGSVAARRARGPTSSNGSDINNGTAHSSVPQAQFNPNTQLGPRHNMHHNRDSTRAPNVDDNFGLCSEHSKRIPNFAPSNPVVNPYDPSFVPGDVRMLERGTHNFPSQVGAAQPVGHFDNMHVQNSLPADAVMNGNPNQMLHRNGGSGIVSNQPVEHTFQGGFLPPVPTISINGIPDTDMHQLSSYQMAIPSTALDAAHTTQHSDQRMGHESPEFTVFVGNLPHTAGPTHVSELFSQYGTVRNIKIINKGANIFGFVRMLTFQECAAAIQGLDKTLVHGLQINVQPGRPKWPTRQTEGYHPRVQHPEPVAMPQFVHEPHFLRDQVRPPPGIWAPGPHSQAGSNTAAPRYDDPRLFSPEGSSRLSYNNYDNNPPAADNHYEQGSSILHFLRGPETSDSLMNLGGRPVVNLPSGSQSGPHVGLANCSPGKKNKKKFNNSDRNNANATAGPLTTPSNRSRKNTNAGIKGSPMRRQKRAQDNSTPNRHDDTKTAQHPVLGASSTSQCHTIEQSFVASASGLEKSTPPTESKDEANGATGKINTSNSSKLLVVSNRDATTATGSSILLSQSQIGENDRISSDRPITATAPQQSKTAENTPSTASELSNSPARQEKMFNGQAVPATSTASQPVQHPSTNQSLSAIVDLGRSASRAAPSHDGASANVIVHTATSSAPTNGSASTNSATPDNGATLASRASKARLTSSVQGGTKTNGTALTTGPTPTNGAAGNGANIINGASSANGPYKKPKGKGPAKHKKQRQDSRSSPPKQTSNGNVRGEVPAAVARNSNSIISNRPLPATAGPRPTIPRPPIPLYQVNPGNRDDNNRLIPPTMPRPVTPLSAPLVKVTPPSDSGRGEKDEYTKVNEERRVSY